MTSDSSLPKRPRGRPPGPEPTHRLRVPESQVPTVVAYLDAHRAPALAHDPRPISRDPSHVALIAFAAHVRAGFPSPADDYIEDVLDLNRHLITAGHEEATFVLRVAGWSMIGAGIHEGDEILVDRARTAREGSVVVAVVNGDLTIKRLVFRHGKPVLASENLHFADITFADEDELVIWGVVTRVLHKL